MMGERFFALGIKRCLIWSYRMAIGIAANVNGSNANSVAVVDTV